MASAQDHHGPVVKELSEKRLPADPTQTGQSQTRPRDAPDSPRPLTSTSETLREPTPPQLPGTLPGTFEPHPLRRATNSATLVNHPGTISIPNTGAGPGGAQNAPIIQDRNQPALYDPIRGDNTTQVHLPDEGEPDRRSAPRRVSVPRPRPVFSPTQDGNGNGNGPRGVPRGVSSTDSLSNPQVQGQVKTNMTRLADTLSAAETERDKYQKRARYQSLTINGAIGLQVIVGALTTGVAAASKNIGAAVAVLGGISTALASYLAKARGSGEPEFSTIRARELNTFIREVKAFNVDHGHKTGSEFDWQITSFRQRFEAIIKTEGEDSASGRNQGPDSRAQHPGNMYHGSQQAMTMAYGGKNYQTGPPQADGGLSEKQMMKNEKAMGGVV